jgi:small subunit ribosomal protein S20
LFLTFGYSKKTVYLPSQNWGTQQEIKEMANHKSSIKRIRSNDAKRTENRYYAKTTRNAVNKLRTSTSKKEAQELLPKVSSMIDKLAKKSVIHKNKAGNLKSKLAKKVASIK